MAEPAEGPALIAYRFAGYAAMPLVPMLLSYRTARGKEEPGRRDERYGRSQAVRPAGPLVWVHAASVGETNAVLPLIGRIAAEGIGVLFTTVTVTSAAIAARRLPSGAFHQYSPLDIVPFVDRFLAKWKPDLALFVESELWPGVMSRLARRRIPQILVNARMSERSFARWQRFGTALRGLFEGTTLALARTEGDASRLGALGMRQVRFVGDLKFDVPAPPADPAAVETFRDGIPGRTVYVAASTHEGEETVVAAAHAQLRRRRPQLLTIIAPRHPERGPAIRDRLVETGLRVALRSRGELILPETDVYLADTLGELGLFYRVAPVAFLGGSLIPHGGQNPIEPVRLQSAIVHGPHVQNFAEIYAALDRADGARTVDDAVGLVAALDEWFADPAAMHRAAVRAAEALSPYSGALDATMAALRPYLQPLAIAARLAPDADPAETPPRPRP